MTSNVLARPVALEIAGLCKSFGGAPALRDVSMRIHAGEIVGLVGENGSGKSTLIKILTGVYSSDSGVVTIGTRPGRPAHSVAVVHQDLGLAEGMSVADNIAVSSRYGARSLGMIRRVRDNAETRAIMQRLGLDFDLERSVSDLSSSERALVAIVRATRSLSDETSLLILDEPTAYLSGDEAALVLRTIRAVAESGVAVIFVSHRLNEVIAVCDRLDVLRSGALVGAITVTPHTEPGDVVTAMLGRALDSFYPERAGCHDEQVVLSVSALTGGRVRDVSFELHTGEIVGVTGLTGMGQEDLPYVLCGVLPRTSGATTLSDGRPLGTTPRAQLTQNVVLVPGNRRRDGLWGEASGSENLSLPLIRRYFRRGRIDRRAEQADANSIFERYGVRPSNPDLRVDAFSGGNQQKILMGKWLRYEPRLLILDEPTQGVDAGARKDILEIVSAAAQNGAAVLICSGDYEQLVEMCSRILVFRFGHVSAELTEPMTEHDVSVACQFSPAPAERPGAQSNA